jgi:hypothetical protein
MEPAHEDHHARQHRRNKRRHGLPEHVAERQQVEKTDGRERPLVAKIFLHFAFHRNDVGENIAVRNDYALGLGGGAGGENDLGGLISRDRNRLSGRRRVARVHAGFVAGQNHSRSDNRVDALDKFTRRAIVDRYRDHACQQASPQCDNPLRPVLAIEDYFFIAADPLFA